MENKIKGKENYFLGILGAILGGLIISVPLAFGYIYSELLFLLAITVFMAGFEFYGYKWFKGKINNKLPIILLIVTIINILIMSLILVPLALLIKSNLPISLETIKNLYNNNKILIKMVQDCLISLVFAVFGVYIVALIIKRKILLNVSNIDLFSSDNKEKQEFKEKAITVLKSKFEKYNATQKEKTITKEELLADLKGKDLNEYFNYLKQLNIIKKYKGKYYYSEDSESNIKANYLGEKLVGGICVTAVLIALILFVFGNVIGKNVRKVYNNDMSFSIDASWNILEDYTEENGWVYYKYLEKNENTDEHLEPSTIAVDYDKNATKSYNSIDDLRVTLEFYLNNVLNYDGYNINIFKTSKGYDAIELIMKYETSMEFDYYIYKDGEVAYITASSYSFEEDILDELEKYAEDIVDSFRWNK